MLKPVQHDGLYIGSRRLLIDYGEGEEDFEDLGDPVGGKDDDEANDPLSEGFFTFFDLVGIVGAGEHLKAGKNNDAQENEAREGKGSIDEEADDARKGSDASTNATGLIDLIEIDYCHINLGSLLVDPAPATT